MQVTSHSNSKYGIEHDEKDLHTNYDFYTSISFLRKVIRDF